MEVKLTMKLTVKILSVAVLIALASPVILLKGCGEIINGGACGGCPNSTAPFGSSVTAPANKTYAVAPDGSWCVNLPAFTFKDPDGDVMNGICVEIFTNGLIAMANAPGDCGTNPNYTDYIRTSTDPGGTITVDIATGTLSCAGNTADETHEFFVQVNSCTTGATWTGTWTVNCAP
jgi:hypothetical protein